MSKSGVMVIIHFLRIFDTTLEATGVDPAI